MLSSSPELKNIFLDKWFEVDPESYNYIYYNSAEIKAGKKVKGITIIAGLSDNFPRIFSKVWNRKPFKDLNKSLLAYDGPIGGYHASMPGAIRIA